MRYISRITLIIATLLTASCASSKTLTKQVEKAADDCLIVEQQEITRFQSSQKLIESNNFVLEISRVTGRQRTSDSGFKLARLMQTSSMSNADVRELLLKKAAEHGLQNWMFAVLQMFDVIDKDEIRAVAEKSGAAPSPFIK